jgi:hypothetical protein
MVKHATNQTHYRFELESCDITSGRQNYELFMERVKSKQLSELVDNLLTKPLDPDPLDSIDSFYEEFNLGEKPLDLDLDRFWYEYVSVRLDHELLRFDQPHTHEAMEIVHAYVNDHLTMKARNKALQQFRAKESARGIVIRQWNTDKREIKKIYENKEHEIKKLIEKNDKKKKNIEEKVSELNDLMILYFSDTIIKKVQPDIDDENYSGAVSKLKTLVFEGTKNESEYLQMVLYHTKVSKDWNLTILPGIDIHYAQ